MGHKEKEIPLGVYPSGNGSSIFRVLTGPLKVHCIRIRTAAVHPPNTPIMYMYTANFRAPWIYPDLSLSFPVCVYVQCCTAGTLKLHWTRKANSTGTARIVCVYLYITLTSRKYLALTTWHEAIFIKQPCKISFLKLSPKQCQRKYKSWGNGTAMYHQEKKSQILGYQFCDFWHWWSTAMGRGGMGSSLLRQEFSDPVH